MADIAQVIKYEGDNQTFIWKHPCEDFNSGTQLIVHESQEAVFFMNGQALDTLGPGRHTLETQNIPLVSGLFNRVTGDTTPFHCEVYFINKTEQMAIKWGTSTKISYEEPIYHIPIQIGACGEMCLRIEDGRKLLIKVVGTEKGISQQQLVDKFRAFLMVKIKSYVPNLIEQKKISIFDIDQHVEAMGSALLELLRADFMEYGVALERFFITNIMKPEDDRNYRELLDLRNRQLLDVEKAKLRQQVGVIDQQTAAQRMVIEAQGLAQKRALEGYTYQDERGFDVAERVAGNQAVGQFTNMGVGMGMIAGVGGTLGNAVGGMMSNTLGQAVSPQPAGTPPPLPPLLPERSARSAAPRFSRMRNSVLNVAKRSCRPRSRASSPVRNAGRKSQRENSALSAELPLRPSVRIAARMSLRGRNSASSAEPN